MANITKVFTKTHTYSGNNFTNVCTSTYQITINEATRQVVVDVTTTAKGTLDRTFTFDMNLNLSDYKVNICNYDGGNNLKTVATGVSVIVPAGSTTATITVGSTSETIDYNGDGTLRIWLYDSLSGTTQPDNIVELDPIINGNIKVNGVWKKCAVWKKISGVWKRCTLWKKINGVWKRGI